MEAGVLLVLGIAGVALVLGLAIGMLVARPLGRWASREPTDEDSE
jgi:hypothetical protein